MKNNILKKSFGLLISNNNDFSINWSFYEEKYDIKYPCKYKIFVENFELGRDKLNLVRYYNPYLKTMISIGGVYCDFDNKKNFEDFNSFVEASDNRDADPSWLDENFLPIGGAGMNETILLGTQGDRIDKIYFHHADIQPEFRFVANDIFEFVRGFVQVAGEEEDLWRDLKYSQFHKRWGDEVWQIEER